MGVCDVEQVGLENLELKILFLEELFSVFDVVQLMILCSIIADPVGGHCATNIHQAKWCVLLLMLDFRKCWFTDWWSFTEQLCLCWQFRLYLSLAFTHRLEFAVIVLTAPLGKAFLFWTLCRYSYIEICIVLYCGLSFVHQVEEMSVKKLDMENGGCVWWKCWWILVFRDGIWVRLYSLETCVIFLKCQLYYLYIIYLIELIKHGNGSLMQLRDLLHLTFLKTMWTQKGKRLVPRKASRKN